MTRSTLHSVRVGFASAAVFCLSLSPLASSAHAAAGVVVTADQTDNVDVIYGDADEGPIDVVRTTATPPQTGVALAPGDVVYGDADEGAIDAGPAPALIAVPARGEIATAAAGQDVLFSDDDMGGAPVDLSAFAGRSNISAAELAGQADLARDTTAAAQQFELQ